MSPNSREALLRNRGRQLRCAQSRFSLMPFSRVHNIAYIGKRIYHAHGDPLCAGGRDESAIAQVGTRHKHL